MNDNETMCVVSCKNPTQHDDLSNQQFKRGTELETIEAGNIGDNHFEKNIRFYNGLLTLKFHEKKLNKSINDLVGNKSRVKSMMTNVINKRLRQLNESTNNKFNDSLCQVEHYLWDMLSAHNKNRRKFFFDLKLKKLFKLNSSLYGGIYNVFEAMFNLNTKLQMTPQLKMKEKKKELELKINDVNETLKNLCTNVHDTILKVVAKIKSTFENVCNHYLNIYHTQEAIHNFENLILQNKSEIIKKENDYGKNYLQDEKLLKNVKFKQKEIKNLIKVLRKNETSDESPEQFINKRLKLLNQASKKSFIEHMCYCEVTEWTRLSNSYRQFADLPRDVLENIQLFYDGVADVLEMIFKAKHEPEKSFQMKLKEMKTILINLVANFSKMPIGSCLLMNKLIEDVYAELIKFM